jgi:hypothetical protein
LISKAAKRRKRQPLAQNEATSKKLVKKNVVEPLELVSAPVNSVSVPSEGVLSDCWFNFYKEMVAIDIEKVQFSLLML